MSVRKSTWKIRRRIIHATLIFCALCVVYVLVGKDERPVVEVIVLGAFGMATSVIGAYIFGAAWDDKNHLPHARGGKPEGDTFQDDYIPGSGRD